MNEIKYSRNTVGCNVGGQIFLHPELYKYPELYFSVLAHERKHTAGINVVDVAIDIFNDDLKGHKKEFYKFVLTHPRTLLGFLPLSKIGNYWAFDLELFIVWVAVLALGGFLGAKI